MTPELYCQASYRRTALAGQPWNGWLMVLHATLHHWHKAHYAKHPHHPPEPHLLQSDLHHSNFFFGLPPAIFFIFLASSRPDLQSPMLAAIHLSGRYATPPTAAEVQSDIFSAYRAHAVTRIRACEYVPMANTINLQLLGLPAAFCFLPRCYSLGNFKGQLSDPCLRLSQR